MNNSEFLKEVYTLIDSEYEAFIHYQKVNLDTLREFDSLCRQHSIRYGLAYGSLLGVVRDKQQIPWDFDIDVFVPYPDYNKLIYALDHYLASDYYYVFNNNMKDYTTFCLRVARKGYSYHALHIDVYFVVGCPSNEKKAQRFTKYVSIYCKLRPKLMKGMHRDATKRTKKQKIAHHVFNLVTLFQGDKVFNFIQKKLSSRCEFGTTEKCMPFVTDRIIYPYRIFSDFIDYQMGDVLVKVPIGYEEFLKNKFGDYHTYLPAKSRFEEFWNVKRSMDELQKYYEHNPYK